MELYWIIAVCGWVILSIFTIYAFTRLEITRRKITNLQLGLFKRTDDDE